MPHYHVIDIGGIGLHDTEFDQRDGTVAAVRDPVRAAAARHCPWTSMFCWTLDRHALTGTVVNHNYFFAFEQG
jgi:hypothetical protein